MTVPMTTPTMVPQVPPAARVLAVWCAAAAADAERAADADDPLAAVRLMARRTGGGGRAEVRVLRAPTLEQLREAARDLRPTHAYLCGGPLSPATAPNPAQGRLGPLSIPRGGGGGGDGSGSGSGSGVSGSCSSNHEIAGALAESAPLQCVYLDASPSSAAPSVADELLLALQQRRRRRADDNGNGKENEPQQQPDQVAVVAWPTDPPAAVAAHFAQAFFAHLAHEPAAAAPVAEAYGVALVATAALASVGPLLPRLPELLLLSPLASPGAPPSDDAQLFLPDARTVPRPAPGDLPAGAASLDALPGWRGAALLAPRCELRLRVAGGAGVAAGADADGGGGGDDDRVRLSYLGEGLRALLAAEVRALELVAPAAPAEAQAAAAAAAAAEDGAAAAAAAPPPTTQPPPPPLLEPLDPSPCPLPETCRAVCAVVRTRSGVRLPVVMVLPDAVIISAADGPGAAAAAASAGGGGAAAGCNGHGNGHAAPTGDHARPALARHALRHALLADALALQLQLPPAGAPLPQPRSQPDLAGGVPGVDCLVRTSAWAAGLLRCLAYSGDGVGGGGGAGGGGGGAQGGDCGERGGAGDQEEEDDASFLGGRALAALGITAVGCTATRAITAADAARLFPLVGASPFSSSRGARDARPPQPQRAEPPTPNPLAVADPGKGSLTAHAAACARPPLAECSDEALAADIAAFWRAQQQKQKQPGQASSAPPPPPPSLGGAPVDLAALYRAVASRGGFAEASCINWRGRVLPRCCPPHAARLAAAPGHALRRIYAERLWPYERAHRGGCEAGAAAGQGAAGAAAAGAGDVSGAERCPICGRGDDDDAGLPPADDWLACDGCDAWVHHSCDRRPGLGTYASYDDEGGQGKAYFCQACGGGEG